MKHLAKKANVAMAALCAYASGQITRSRAMQMLDFAWYGQLKDALAAANVSMAGNPARHREMVAIAVALLGDQGVTPVRVVVPDIGPLITLAKTGALKALLALKPRAQIVVSDYAAFEATRRRGELADAKKIDRFLRDNAGRIAVARTGLGQNYLQLARLHETFAGDPALAAQMGADPGETMVLEYVCDLAGKPTGTPELILAEDDSLLRELSPLPANVYVLSTRAFLESLYKRLAGSAALKYAHAAAAHDKRFREQVAIGLTEADKAATQWVSNDEVKAEGARLRAAWRKRAGEPAKAKTK